MTDTFTAKHRYARITARKARPLGRGIQRMALDRVTLAGGTTEAAMQAQKPDHN